MKHKWFTINAKSIIKNGHHLVKSFPTYEHKWILKSIDFFLLACGIYYPWGSQKSSWICAQVPIDKKKYSINMKWHKNVTISKYYRISCFVGEISNVTVWFNFFFNSCKSDFVFSSSLFLKNPIHLTGLIMQKTKSDHKRESHKMTPMIDRLAWLWSMKLYHLIIINEKKANYDAGQFGIV